MLLVGDPMIDLCYQNFPLSSSLEESSFPTNYLHHFFVIIWSFFSALTLALRHTEE
jgi:hypothetical protein